MLFATQQEQKVSFLSRVEGFNLAQCATLSLPGVGEKCSLYLPYFCWLEQGRSHSTRDTHKCQTHGVMCLAISNGDTGKTSFFAALENGQFDRWSYAETTQECGVLAAQLKNMENQATFVEIFCYKQRFTTDLNAGLFRACLSGQTYYRGQQHEEEDRIAREQQRGYQGMGSASAGMLPRYFQRTSQC